jgi:uncharacterized protein
MNWESQVRHNVPQSQFEIDEGGRMAVAQYQRRGDVIAFTHTFVPPELRGQGVGSALARAALTTARREKLKVRPDCAFFAKYMQSHTDTQDLLA